MNSYSSNRAESIELLAPAGDWQCAQAAIENGADAIYFGLDCGFNARHRAKNFGMADLAELGQMLRLRGVRGYATLNTLVFPSEMKALVAVVEQIAQAGLDAVLVQDFGVARLVRQVCPELQIHASTQMSLTSAETIEVARQLGLSRVVLARELSVSEIAKISEATDMPLEVFIHGALCVAYSGQCLTSESLGGRSANRGQCAQACRLPYELICDGETRDLDQVRYLLSPQDLAGYAAIPDLINAGVCSLKIEGRLKTPEYVANITHHYREAIDEALATGAVTIDENAKRDMELSFSRGFSPGWLNGNDHKRLVPGIDSSKRGVELGSIEEIQPHKHRVRVRLCAPVSLGDGLAIRSAGDQTDQGGRIYSLEDEQGHRLEDCQMGDAIWIGFGREDIDWSRVEIDAKVWKNDDPKLNRRLRQTFTGEDPVRRQGIEMTVVAETGKPISITASIPGGPSMTLSGAEGLAAATKRPATESLLSEKLGRLGGTPFQLCRLTATLSGGPMVPMKLLNQMRRDLVDGLVHQLQQPPRRLIHADSAPELLAPIEETAPVAKTQLAVMCRTLEQLEAICRSGADLVYADFHDIRRYADAVAIARSHGVPIGLASVRVQKPGEAGLIKVIQRHQPDWMLARNLAAMDFCRRHEMPFIADFSMNVANHRSAEWIRSLGAQRITASYDLNRQQLFELVETMPASWLEVVIHQHMPMFHMEHCVFCSVLSPGTNKTNCGRPCDHHVVELRDRAQAEHLLVADVACRNTLYNAKPQSGAEIVDDLIARQVGCLRIELLKEDAAQATSTVAAYRRLLDGQVSGKQVWRQLQADNRVGVTRGTLESSRDPLAIL